MAVASEGRRRFRRDRTLSAKYALVPLTIETTPDARRRRRIEDDRLRMMFVALPSCAADGVERRRRPTGRRPTAAPSPRPGTVARIVRQETSPREFRSRFEGEELDGGSVLAVTYVTSTRGTRRRGAVDVLICVARRCASADNSRMSPDEASPRARRSWSLQSSLGARLGPSGKCLAIKTGDVGTTAHPSRPAPPRRRTRPGPYSCKQRSRMPLTGEQRRSHRLAASSVRRLVDATGFPTVQPCGCCLDGFGACRRPATRRRSPKPARSIATTYQ
jgi:hypothetical protein